MFPFSILPLGKVNVKVKFPLEEAMRAVEFYSFFNLGVWRRWEVNATPWPLCPRERNSIPIV